MGGSSILLGGGMVEDLLFPTTSNFQDETSIRGELSGLDPFCFHPGPALVSKKDRNSQEHYFARDLWAHLFMKG